MTNMIMLTYLPNIRHHAGIEYWFQMYQSLIVLLLHLLKKKIKYLCTIIYLLLCVRHQTVTPDFTMKEAVRCRSSRLPWSLLVISLGTGQILFLVFWYFGHLCRTCSVVSLSSPQGQKSDSPILNLLNNI